MSHFSTTILGSASATPFNGRFPSAQVLQCGNQFFLIDCGEGTLFRMLNFGVKPHKISHIFISHIHPDHYLGIFNLLFNWAMNKRTQPLYIAAPPELKTIIDLQLSLSQIVLPFELQFIGTDNQSINLICETENLTAHSLPLRHSIACTGFLFTQKQTNLRYAYLTDTTPMPELKPILEQTDLLYHEATYLHNLKEKAEQYFHSTAQQAAEMAAHYNVKKMILGHFSARYPNLNPILEEAKQTFENTALAIEGTTFEVG